MKCIQNVPASATAYLSMAFVSDSGRVLIAIDIQPTTAQTVAMVRQSIAHMAGRGSKPVWDDESFCVWRMRKPLTHDDIAASIRRKRPRRTLLSVQAECVFADDLDVQDYWTIDWKTTVEILKELDR